MNEVSIYLAPAIFFSASAASSSASSSSSDLPCFDADGLGDHAAQEGDALDQLGQGLQQQDAEAQRDQQVSTGQRIRPPAFCGHLAGLTQAL
jgi:hypothetical protein